MDPYTGGVDWGFLKAMRISWVHYQPWQLGLFHQDLKGKFVWYPRKGTLMYQCDDDDVTTYKIGNTGDFQGQDDTTENVYNEIMKKITEQQQ